MHRYLAMFVMLSSVFAFSETSHAQLKPSDLENYTAALKALKSTNASDRITGLNTLAQLGTDAIGASRDICLALLDQDKAVREKAGQALDRVNPEISVDAQVIVRVILQDPDDEVMSVNRLVKLGDKAAPTVPLVKMYLKRIRGVDRPKVIEKLATIGRTDPELSGYLAKLAVEEVTAGPRAAAIAALPKMVNGKAGMDVFNKILTAKDGDADKQMRAITAVSEIGKGNADAIKMLQATINSEQTSDAVRVAAHKALQKIQVK